MATGTIHLLSISGLHVGILSGGVWLLARVGWLSRKKTLALAGLFVVLYTLLTEARPPVVRAAVLVVVMCTARFLGRQAFSGNTLAAAGLVVLGINPSAFFHAGTQLSFLAVATIALIPRSSTAGVADPLTRLIAETRPWPVRAARRWIRAVFQAVGLSTAIWLVALPLVAYRFHLVSPVATILNPIVCVPMAVSLFAGLGVMVTGGVAPPLASLLGKVCDLSLAAMEWCQDEALEWWGSHWWTPAPPGWWVLVFYGVSVVWLIWPGLRPPRRWVCAIALLWFALGGGLTMGPRARPVDPSGGLDCHFIAVGHGTSVLLEFPSGATLLYDAGRLGIASSAARSIAGVLWSRGVTHLDALVISHADADHYNAIPDLLQRFSVGTIYVSPLMFRNESVSLRALLSRIRQAGIPIRELSAGDRLQTGDRTRVEILHPPVTTRPGSDNANSIVLLVAWQGSRVLLPGDLESPGFEELLARPRAVCDVVMVPHHGSSRSDPIAFGSWSLPEHAVISGGAGRDARPVVQAYQSVGARVYHTAEAGCVHVELRSGNCRVTTFRPVAGVR
jgi:competence protein ComEC